LSLSISTGCGVLQSPNLFSTASSIMSRMSDPLMPAFTTARQVNRHEALRQENERYQTLFNLAVREEEPWQADDAWPARVASADKSP
jgi:hypothetical protein